MQKIDKTDTLETILTRGKFEVDYYQREYRWGRKQIEQMLMDFYDTFRQYYDPANHARPPKCRDTGITIWAVSSAPVRTPAKLLMVNSDLPLCRCS